MTKRLMAVILAAIMCVGIVPWNVTDCRAAEQVSLTWNYIVYGNGSKAANASYTGKISGTSGSVTLTSGKLTDGKLTGENNNGKMVPASYDGMNFYYTKIPTSVNFTFRAKVKVDQWWLSNGQEGLGVMVTDKLGGKGWNNSYMLCASTNSYKWNGTQVDSTNGKSITQKLGIVNYAKSGVTNSNISAMESGDTQVIQRDFVAESYPMDQRYPESVNVVGNGLNCPSGIDNPITEFYATIQKNNTGYFITYESADGTYSHTKKYYDTEVLSQLDKDYVYVGFFTSRYAQATFSEVSFTSVEPDKDAPAEAQPVEKIPVKVSNYSLKNTGNTAYTVSFKTNCDGKMTVKTSSGTIIAKDIEVKAGSIVDVANTTLSIGNNSFVTEFVPDASYIPGKNQVMESYEMVKNSWNVVCKQAGEENGKLYVSPEGIGDGTYSNPMSLTEAFNCVRPGQSIVLKEGVYKVSSTVKVARGINGTADKMIRLVADDKAATRPVFDAEKKCTVMQIIGDYWYCSGFDITNSSNGSSGLVLCGSHCVLDNINAYHNGNTGIQIARYDSGDEFDKWPSYNLVVNCTSYGNADLGYEDADGFAAKITSGVGNVFDNCIAYNNADDGWDLFAKVQTGSIGAVTIRNCVAYGNGYLEDGTVAGNGNGFKLGGDGLSGHHVLENSIAFNNKANGIDSNSCPDIIVRNCTSYNNGSANISISSSVANTDYEVEGYIGYRDRSWAEKFSNNEYINCRGNQDKTKVYKTNNYYWNSGDVVADASWFVSVDTKFDTSRHLFTEQVVTRNADNSINMNGLLELTSKAPQNAGARMTAWVNESDNTTNGLANKDGIWAYYANGSIDTTYTGFVEANGNKWYITQGILDTSVTGLRYDGKQWLCVRGGKYDASTGLILNAGYYWYVDNGILVEDYRGIVENAGFTWYVVNGKLNTEFTGIGTNGSEFWYVVNGKVRTDYTGLYNYAGSWWYVTNGRVATGYKGLVENAGYKWYVVNGKIDVNFTGIGIDVDGSFVAVRAGKFDGTTGLLLYNNTYWYMNNGILDTSYSGTVDYAGCSWVVVNGKMIRKQV